MAALDRAERYAKSPHCTPEEHDDIMVAVRLARQNTRLASQPPAALPASPPEIAGVVEKLKGLLAKATPGPWELQDGCSWRRIGTRGRDGSVLCPDTYSREDRHPDLTAGKGEDLYANLTLIVEAVNALPSLLSALEALAAREAAMREALDWFGTQRNLEMVFYSPFYCDDDDQAEEWRVFRVGGSINDREWDQVGQGETPLDAIIAARAALTPTGDDQ